MPRPPEFHRRGPAALAPAAALALALTPTLAGAVDGKVVKASGSNIAAVINSGGSGPKPLARYWVAAVGGYSTGPDTMVTLGAATDADAAALKVVVRNVATGTNKVAVLTGSGRTRAFQIDGYGPCAAGLDLAKSAQHAIIPTGKLWEIDVYTSAQMPSATAPKAYTTNLATIKGGLTATRAVGLRWFDPATGADGGANWNPEAHKAIDGGCCDTTSRPGPEPWPEPEPSAATISP